MFDHFSASRPSAIRCTTVAVISKSFRGLRDLGTLGGPMSVAYSVSDNGLVAVGTSLTTSSSSSNHAFRWTAKNGMQDIQQALVKAGVTSVQGWILFTANRVSSDGTVIVGSGLNPNRQWEAFRAVLSLP